MSRTGRLSGRQVLVTGASSGLGEAVARRVVREGGDVLLIARRAAALERVVASLPTGRAHFLAADLSGSEEPDRIAECVTALWGGLDGAFISHGGPAPSTAVELTDGVLRDAVALAAVAPIRMLRTAARLARRSASLVVLTSSTAYEPVPGMAPSNLTRPAVQSYAKTLARELGEREIRVNAIVPGRFATARLAQISGQGGPMQGHAAIPLGRVGHPDELASAALFLLSDEASYVTGAGLTVDGGRRLTI